MTGRLDWASERANVLIAELNVRGLTIEPNEARELITQRIAELSESMSISAKAAQQHVTDYAIVDLAETLAGLMSDEAPGVDLMQEPLSVVLSQKLIGRTAAGLAESILFFQREGNRPAAGDSIRELAEHLSLLGSILAD